MSQNPGKISSHDKYHRLMSMTGSGAFTVDRALDSGNISGILHDIFNVNDLSLTVEDYFNKIPPVHKERIKEKLTQAYKNADDIELIYPLERGQKFIWVKVKGTALDEETYFLVHQVIEEVKAYDHLDIKSEIKNILNAIPVPVLILTQDENITFINNTFKEITGYTENDLSTIDDWVNKAYQDKATDIYNLIKKLFGITSRVDDGTFEVRVKSGEIKTFHFFTAPLGKNIYGQKQILSIAIDVSESYTKDRLIKQQSEELHILIEKLPYMLITADAEGELVYANSKVMAYSGYSSEQIKSQWVTFVHPEDRQRVLKQREHSISTGTTFVSDFRLKHRDGTYRWFNFKFLPVKNKNNKIIKWVGSGIDVHEEYMSQHQLTESLKKEVSHLDEIIESLPQMAWTADPDGEMDYFNKRWYNYTGQNPDEALGDGWKKVLHPEDIEETMKEFNKSIETLEDLEVEARFLNAEDNTYCWHLIKALPVKNSEKKIDYWIGTATNIHEQKMLEYNKGEFLNVASHELRTPLTSLTGYLQLMEDALEKSQYHNLKFYLGKSLNSTYRINRLVNDLLNLSNVESGKIADFHKEEINFRKFVNDIIKNYQQLYPKREFIFNTTAKIFKTWGNAFRLEQVLDNLISNSLKYAPNSPIYINLKKQKDKLLIEVSDEGKGIPQNKLSAVFDRFYRIKDNALSSGLGVGLFISREIIEQHDGEIWAERNDDKGITFKFTLPVA
ncbi:MAG: PAS domain-containing protein [Candidatus Cyclobacteriaceae bacterium M2_1C_046]